MWDQKKFAGIDLGVNFAVSISKSTPVPNLL
jgi:hypothetical protein